MSALITTLGTTRDALSAQTASLWCAAWQTTIDPDMYQVYHKESSATSVKNWGYPFLLDHGSDEELEIIDDLSDLIDAGRETTKQTERKGIYKEAGLANFSDTVVLNAEYLRKLTISNLA